MSALKVNNLFQSNHTYMLCRDYYSDDIPTTLAFPTQQLVLLGAIAYLASSLLTRLTPSVAVRHWSLEGIWWLKWPSCIWLDSILRLIDEETQQNVSNKNIIVRIYWSFLLYSYQLLLDISDIYYTKPWRIVLYNELQTTDIDCCY